MGPSLILTVASRAPARALVREPYAGNPHVRFDERDVETEPSATATHLDSTHSRDPSPGRHT